MADTDVVSEDLTIRAPGATVYKTLTNFEAYPDWLTEIKAATITRPGRDGQPEEVHFTMGAVGISLGITLEYVYTEDRVQWHLVRGDMLQRLDGSYQMVDAGADTTKLTYSLEIDSNLPVPGLVRRRIAKKIVADTLKAIKQRAESQA